MVERDSIVSSRLVKRGAIAVFFFWSILLCALALWNYAHTRRTAKDIGLNHAIASFEKDLVYRRWASQHGGVYVPSTDQTPPNPYLSHIPERDITTPSGRNLTLLNPAYMTRQVFALGLKQYGFRAHITSLNPINPINMPDAWEREQLEHFKQTPETVTSIEQINAERYLRYMRPMVTEQECMKCHEAQGYKVGDIRGGISVYIPMKSIWAAASKQTAGITFGLSLVWALGVFGLVFGRRFSLKRIQEADATQKDLADLARFPSENPSPVFRLTTEGKIIYANGQVQRLRNAWHGKSADRIPPEYAEVARDAMASGKVYEILLIKRGTKQG